jgi:autotransporter-associated beta strand protein
VKNYVALARFGLIVASLIILMPLSARAANASFTILSGTSTNTTESLGNGQTGTVQVNATLSITNGTLIAIAGTSTSSSNQITVTNSGTISSGKLSTSGRAIRDQSGGSNLLIYNNTTGLITSAGNDTIAINTKNSSTNNTLSVVDIENYGTIQSLDSNGSGGTVETGSGTKGNQPINMTVTIGANTVFNHSNGVIWATAADGVRPGLNGVVKNDGFIYSNAYQGSGSDGIDGQTDYGITIYNGYTTTTSNMATYTGAITGYTGATLTTPVTMTQSTIEGGRHGITGGNTGTNTSSPTYVDSTNTNGAGYYTMTIYNNGGALIEGQNGSGINIDGFGFQTTSNTPYISNEHVTVTNYGTIYGNGVTGDGDGIDVDGNVTVTNFGRIQSLNANGDVSEGVTVGGAVIVNSGTHAIIEGSLTSSNTTPGSFGRGITLAGVDKGADDSQIPIESIYENSTITNTNGGLIKGDTESGIAVLGTTGGGYNVTITNGSNSTIEGNNTGVNQNSVIVSTNQYNGLSSGKTLNQGAIELDDTGNTYTVLNSGTIQQDNATAGFAVEMHSSTSNVLTVTGGAASIIGSVSGNAAAAVNTFTINPGTGNTFTYNYSISNFSVVINSDANSGTVALNGSSTYGGGTTVDAGTLVIGTNSALGTGAVIAADPTITYTNSITVTNPIIMEGATSLEVDNTDSATQSGVISSTNTGYTLTKAGTGTLTLTAANTDSVGTTVSAGTLVADTNSALGTGSVTVQNGGTLAVGDGTNTVTLAIGGNYTQSSGGAITFSLHSNTISDQANVTGTASVSGTINVNFNQNPTAPSSLPGAPATQYTYTLITSSNEVGTFSTLDTTNAPTNVTATLVYQNNDVILDVTSGAVFFPTTVPGLNGNQQSVLVSINTGLGKSAPGSSFAALTTALGTLYAGDPGAFGGALNELTTLGFANFSSSTAFNNASFYTQAIDSYLANHRGADGSFVGSAGGIDSSGLAINDPSVDPALQGVHSRLLAWNPAPSTGRISDSPVVDMGGVDMKESQTAVQPSGSDNPWDFFISGNAILAQDFSNASAGTSHIDATTGAVELGVDYKITSHVLVGAMFGYGHTDATLDNIGSKSSVDSYSPGVYASYADSGWYANALASYGFDSFSQDRNVSIGAFGGTAHSSPGGDQIVGDIDGGYDFHRHGWTFGPTLGVQYTHLDVDGFTESGLPGADLTVNKDESDSLRGGLGGRVSYAFQGAGVEFTPHLSAAWQHEFMDQSRGITSQFNGVGAGSFSVKTVNPSRDSALVDLGLDAEIDQTWTVYTDYSVQAGQSNYFGQAIQAGVKVSF